MAPIIGIGIGVNRQGRGATSTPAAPANTSLPTISGSTISGQQLTAFRGIWTGYPAPSYTYQWKRNGVDIGGATSTTYTLVSADVGNTITVTVTATNSEGSANATSLGAGPVASVPANTVLPSISGTPTVGQILTSSTGTWTGTPTPTYAYQWRRDGVSIEGATTSTYALAEVDEGTLISVTVTASNIAGSAATSAQVGPIASAPAARVLNSVAVAAYSSGSYAVTLVGNAVDGETVEWVLYSGTNPANGNEVDAGSWAGATVVDNGTFAWAATPAPITLDTGIARANYKLTCIVNNGAVSNAVISDPFEVDTTASLLTLEAFADDGLEGVDGEFQSNEAVTYRASLWADGSTPSAAQRESGTGSVATLTGSAAAGVLETFNFTAVGPGTYVPTLWVVDIYDNEYSETYADVTVAAAVSGPVVSAYSGFSLAAGVNIGGTLYDIYTSTSLTPSITFSNGGSVDYLIVGGGGGGGNGELRAGGGGGGGEVKSGTTTVTATTYNPTVGAGGAGGIAATSGSTGGSSTFNGITSAGGGGGGRNLAAGLASVNSGGSGFSVGTSTASTGGGFAGGAGLNDGSNNGAPGGGGAGMTANGQVGVVSTNGGDGGAGLSNSITGSAVVYGSGGGGGMKGTVGRGGNGGSGAGNGGLDTAAGQAGTNGRGGGGGGGGSGSALGGRGGDGVIIIRVVA